MRRLLVNPSDPDVTRRTFDESRIAADRLNLTLEQVEARAPSDLEEAFSTIIENKFDGVVVTSDPMLFSQRRKIGEWAIARKLPTMMFNGEMPKSGGVMSYSADNPALFRRAGAFVVKVLQGTRPANLPVELPTKFELVINISQVIGSSCPRRVARRRRPGDRMIAGMKRREFITLLGGAAAA